MSTDVQIPYFKKTSPNSNNFYQHILHIKKKNFLRIAYICKGFTESPVRGRFSHTWNTAQFNIRKTNPTTQFVDKEAKC